VQVKPVLRRLHRYVAFAFGLLWLSQALTGLLMVYRWEIDDATVATAVRDVPLDVDALGARIAAIEAGQPGAVVSQLWATGGVDGRYDLYVDLPDGRRDVVRIDGTGSVLRHRTSDWDFRDGGFISLAADLHQTLFAGDRGKLIVGLSGTFLLANVVMGLVLAWPARARQWRVALAPKGARRGAARRYAWHRAVGLWLAVPALLFFSAGILLTVESYLEQWLGLDETPAEVLVAPRLSGPPVAPAQAIAAALQRFPSSELSGAVFPTPAEPWYRIRVRQPDEWRRVYGTSVVYVAGATGHVLRVEDALHAPPRRAFVDSLYPVHTGEVAGPAGRWLALGVAAWLATMLVLGFGLWLARRR
jgi:uncharacterized iron-regulated membrane protein